MFSSTYSPTAMRFAEEYLHNNIWFGVGGLNDTVKQSLEIVEPDKKDVRLVAILRSFIEEQTAVRDVKKKPRCMILCNRNDSAIQLNELLRQAGVMTCALHGGLAQREREDAIGMFRNGEILILISSDGAVSGLDIRGLSLVINFDLPNEIASYVQRRGCTGPFGYKQGHVLTFVSCDDAGNCLEDMQHMKSLMQLMTEVVTSGYPPDWLQRMVDAYAAMDGGGCTGTTGGDPWAGDGGENSWSGRRGDVAGSSND